MPGSLELPGHRCLSLDYEAEQIWCAAGTAGPAVPGDVPAVAAGTGWPGAGRRMTQPCDFPAATRLLTAITG
jgi:hypothetical protein